MLFNVFEHPVTADIILMTPSDTEKSAMVTDDCSAELGNIIFKVNEILRLFVSCDIVEMNIFVAPFEVMDYPFIRQLFLDDENILKEVYNPLLDIKVIKLCDHGLLVL